MKTTWLLFWSLTGEPLIKVVAMTATLAKKATPAPYKRFKAEVSVMSLEDYERTIGPMNRRLDTKEI